MQNRRLITVFLIVFVGLLGLSIILPLLPYYAETFGASPTVVGLLTASYAAARVFGPLIGGYALERLGNWSPGVIAAAVLAWLAVYFWRKLMVRPVTAETAL